MEAGCLRLATERGEKEESVCAGFPITATFSLSGGDIEAVETNCFLLFTALFVWSPNAFCTGLVLGG